MNNNDIENLINDFMQHFTTNNFYLLILIFDQETFLWKDYNNGGNQLYELDAISKNNYQKGKTMSQLNTIFSPIRNPYKVQRNKPKDSESKDDIIRRLEVELNLKDKIIDDLKNEVKELKADLSKALKRAEVAEKRADNAEKRADNLQLQLDELKMMFTQHMKEFHSQ